MSVFWQNLLSEVLIRPAKEGCDRLQILTGYASAAMVGRHFDELKSAGAASTKIELIIGMTTGRDGIPSRDHRAYKQFMESILRGQFSCSYFASPPNTHSKVYLWFRNGRPERAYLGSANYTQNAFSQNQNEVLGMADPARVHAYLDEMARRTIYCNHLDAAEFVRDDQELRRPEVALEARGGSVATGEKVTLPLTSDGVVPNRSGLNWGQRPEYNRDPNQAYISVPAEVQRSGFFPDRPKYFTVVTDDDKSMICVRAQDNGKAIQTPLNNSLIGEYFRNRLGVPSGELVTIEHLQRYGRMDVDFYKIDDETYAMDFSKPLPARP